MDDNCEELVGTLTAQLRTLSLSLNCSLPHPVKVERNLDVLKRILNSSGDSQCTDGFLDVLNQGKVYELQDLESTNPKHQEIKSLFASTQNPQRDSWKVNSVKKVLCPYLLASYLLRKQQKKTSDSSTVKEAQLWHGTSQTNLTLICQNNFDWRRTTQHLFGRGVSFARRSTYACHYPKSDNIPRLLVLAKVMYTKISLGNALMNVPPENCDTSGKPNLDVLVKYDDGEFFPEYVVYYDSSPLFEDDLKLIMSIMKAQFGLFKNV